MPARNERPSPRSRAPAPGRASADDRSEERLQRTLAGAGLGSRRAAEDLIRQGRVRIGGRVAQLGDRVDPSRDRITVDGLVVPTHPDLRYLALNKPAGVTSTLRDRHAARSLHSLIPPGPRVFPVGRLDRESEGLLLLTNDGELAHRVQHPRYGIEKEYLVEVKGEISREVLRRLVRGVPLEDGMARAVSASKVGLSRGVSALSVVMAEGRKREVRRMLAALRFPVMRLVRVRVGPVRLGRIAPGDTREVSSHEIEALYRATQLESASPRTRGSEKPESSSTA